MASSFKEPGNANVSLRGNPGDSTSEKMLAERGPSTLAALIAGSVGGAVQVIVGQPLDTLKVRAQLAAPGQYRNTMDIALQTIRKEGFFALYKGMASPLIGIAGVNALLFAAYAQAKKLVSPYPTLTLPQLALAGGIAGGVNSLLASPVELFKIRMQGQYGAATDKKLRHIFQETLTQKGFRHGVMRGFWITVLREIPAYAGFYTAYEFSKRTLHKRLLGPQATGDQSLPVWATLTAGATGGIAYWTACYPFDVVKSRVQNTTTPLRGMSYIRDTFAQILREGGPRALVRGITPTYIRAVPAAASTFVAFELTLDVLKKQTSLY